MMLPKALLVLGFLALAAASARAGEITTIAGTGTPGSSGDGGAALGAQLNLPLGIAVAPDGTIFFADDANFRVRKMLHVLPRPTNDGVKLTWPRKNPG